jgi:hypothetical protein
MLVAAGACVIFAIYMMFDTRTPARASTFVDLVESETVYASYFDELVRLSLEAEPISWIQVIPHRENDEPPEIIEPFFVPGLSNSSPLHDIPFEYTSLPFFIPENADLYVTFRYERPDLDMETVIWKVNASVHVPFYSQIRINHQPKPLFITPAYRLPPDFRPEELVPVNSDTCPLRATPETVYAFRNLRTASQRAGLNISATSAFRTATRQSELWINGGRRDGRIARPYHSEHQTGRALDLWGPGGLLDSGGPSPTGRWVAANAHYYGFIIRYRAETTHITGYIHEPWHITYVGIAISMYMHENGILSLEEFVGRNPGAALS